MSKRSSPERDVFDKVRLPPALDGALRRMNPWWTGEPAKPRPRFRRAAFARVMRDLTSGLTPITVLRGPRQVGKSTILGQIVDQLLGEGVDPRRILHVQFDELEPLTELDLPIHEITLWFQERILGRTFNSASIAGAPAYVLLDEVQNLKGWAAELKNLVDVDSVRVLVTGSSALRIELGRDSLAGRITTIELGPLALPEIASLAHGASLPALLPANGVEPLARKETWIELRSHALRHRSERDLAFRSWSERGGYPRAQEHRDRPWPEIADHLVETVVNRAIQHDLRRGERGRKRDESLLKEMFRLACRYTGQAPGPAVFGADIKSALSANIGWQRIQAYLRFLDAALLVRLIQPLELRLKRKRGAPKICVCDLGLRAAWLHEVVPLHHEGLADQPHLADIAGRLAESAVGYYLASVPHLDVAHFPERGSEPEVDFVVTVGDRRIPVEVKYRRRLDGFEDTRGLRAFVEKAAYNAPFAILVTQTDDVEVDDPRIVPLPLSSLLCLR